MADVRQQQLKKVLLVLLPDDFSTVSNLVLVDRFSSVIHDVGLKAIR